MCYAEIMKQKSQKTSKYAPSLKEKIFVTTTIGFILVALLVIAVGYVVPSQVNAARKSEIVSVFDSIKLDQSYSLQSENIFGKKQVYDWDKSRSYSSSRGYIRAADASSTAKDLRKRIQDAGFKEIDHPYPYQWQYSSANGTYVRFDAIGKARSDCYFNMSTMKMSTSSCPDGNQGPTEVTLKVNLDDNNE